MSADRVRFLIVGAGISGCTAARLLQLAGEDRFVILEAESEAGGLCRSKQIGPHILDIGGGHLLCSHFPEVSEFIFSHIPRSEFREFDRVSKVAIEAEIIDYPIEFNLWQLTAAKGRRYYDSALNAGDATGEAPPETYEEWIRWKLGEEIAEHYMLPYNRKMWGVEAHEMDIDWLSKIPRVDCDAIRHSWNAHDSLRGRMPSHETFLYPREGGFQRIFDAISAPVAHRIRLNQPLRSLEYAGGAWHANNSIEAEIVITTIPWPAFPAIEGADPLLATHIANLRSTSLMVSLHEESYSHDWHWIYCPDEEVRHHREFFIHNFAPHSAPGGVSRETHTKRWTGKDGEIYSHSNPFAYPIPLLGHSAAAQAVLGFHASRQIYGLGRWGQHRYLNVDDCIREAMQLVKGLLS